MFKDLIVLNKDQHANSGIVPLESYAFTANLHVAAVAVHEFTKLAGLYPIVFLQNEMGDFSTVALLGIDEGRNLFVNEQGQWTVSYVPAVIRKYPFTLLQKDAEQKEFVVCIDQASGCLKNEGGQPLFDEQGQPAPTLEGAVKFLSELQEMDVQTRRFCQVIKELGLIVPLNVELRMQTGIRKVAGAFIVDEMALKNLSSDQLVKLQRENYTSLLYSHLLSLNQFERLVNLANAPLQIKQKESVETNPEMTSTKNEALSKKTRKRSR